MGDNSKELPNAKLHLQEKMREWLGANQEIYSKFKDKIQSVLKDSLRDNGKEQADEVKEIVSYHEMVVSRHNTVISWHDTIVLRHATDIYRDFVKSLS